MKGKKDWPILEKWLNRFSSQSTKYQYRSCLRKFFEFIDVPPDEYVKDKNRDFEQDILDYDALLKSKCAPTSIPIQISAIRNFLEDNGIALPRRFWQNIRKRGIGTEVLRDDRIPTPEELRKILSHAKDAKERAYFLILVTSGMRPEELCLIKQDQFDFSLSPTIVRIPARLAPNKFTKNKSKRITFITEEAKEALIEWIRQRPKYIKQSITKSAFVRKQYEAMGFKFIRNNGSWCVSKDGKEISFTQLSDKVERLFPFTTAIARSAWNRMLEKAGLDKIDSATKHHVIHLYTLRKYFNTRLKEVIPEHVVEYFMGHRGYLNSSYDRPTEEKLAEYYKKGMNNLFVYERPANQDEIDKMQTQISELQTQLTSILEFQQRVASVPVEDEDGDPVIRDGEIQYRIDDSISKEAIVDAFRQEQQRLKDKQYQKLVEMVGEKRAKKIWNIKV